MADTPKAFDVIVMPNLYGDILSDVAAQIAGSVGLAGSANIGEQCAMFEAIHGSAPRRAGQDLANPSGLLQGAVMMLIHLGQTEVAEKVQNAWLKTIEDGIHTYDIFKEGISKQKVGTQGFADAVINNMHKDPATLKKVIYEKGNVIKIPKYVRRPSAVKELLGVDLFVHWTGSEADELAKKLRDLNNDDLSLTMITNRGIKVWPNGFEETFCTDHWRCRFSSRNGAIRNGHLVALLNDSVENNIDVVKTENLYAFDGKPCFSLGQGQ